MIHPLQQTLERYLALCSQTLRPSSVKGKRIDLQCMVQFLRHHYPKVRSWAHVRRVPHIERWLNQLHDSPLKPNTRITRIGALHRFFDDMFDWQWPEAPPPNLILQTDLPPKEYHLPKPLPQDVDQALMELLRRVPSLRTLGLLLLRQTGMRIGELVDLDVNALDQRDPGNSTLHIPLGKTRTEHVIPVNTETADIVHAIQAQRGSKLGSTPIPASTTPYLMVDPRGKRPCRCTYGLTLKKLAPSLSTTERLYPHRLRHTFATEMIRAGMSIQVLMKILGHTNAAMTMRYVEIATADLRRDYDNAMKQLGVLKNLKLPVPVSRSTEPTNLHGIIDILITTLETLHRDSANTPLASPLARFVKRLRRTRDDLNRLLEKAE